VHPGVRGPWIRRRVVGRQERVIDPHETLIALAEVAAAFAGFSGVVAAFGHRSPSEWSVATRFRFENLLTVSVAASLFAFLPVVLAHLSFSPRVGWSWSGGALASFCIVFLAQTFRRGLEVRAGGGGLRRWIAIVWSAGMTGVALAQLVALMAPAESAGGLYVAGILVLLAISGLQFIVMALDSTSTGPQARPGMQGMDDDTPGSG